MRMIICGSRTFGYTHDDMAHKIEDPRQLFLIFNYLQGVRSCTPADLTIITGGADGADTFANRWAVANSRLQWPFKLYYEVMKADWARHGRAAGPIRNDQMLKFLLSIEDDYRVAAFIDKPLSESKGTSNMVTIASKAGVECDIIQTLR